MSLGGWPSDDGPLLEWRSLRLSDGPPPSSGVSERWRDWRRRNGGSAARKRDVCVCVLWMSAVGGVGLGSALDRGSAGAVGGEPTATHCHCDAALRSGASPSLSHSLCVPCAVLVCA